MIPTRLELKNFLPYTSPEPVRFEGIHLACLTGNNGAGKSSLLDAITWALWGKARTKRDDELVHLGEKDMHVQLDFEQEGQSYRVLRRRTRGKRGQGTLDLFVFREDGSPNNISEGGIRETQRKVETLLRLDYETFVHSAFLQQGKADAFTTRTPAERKQILSDILGLDRWMQYEDAVKETLKEIDSNLNYFEQRIEEIRRELEKQPGLQRERDEADENYRTAQEALRTAEEQMRELEHVPGDLRAAQETKIARERRISELSADLDNLDEQIQRSREQIVEYQDTVDQQEQIEAGYLALQEARETNEALSDTLLKLKNLNDERYSLQSQLDKARTRLEGEITAVEDRISELETVDADAVMEELETVQAGVTELEVREVERDKLADAINDMKIEHAGFKSTLRSKESEGKELRERLDKLESTDPKAAVCPLCGQPLGPAERKKLVADLQAEIEARREEYGQILKDIEARDVTIKTDGETLKAMNDELAALPRLRQQMGNLQNRIETAEDAARRLESEREQLATLQTRLDEADFAHDVREQLAELDALDAQLDYDEDSHADSRKQLDQHRQFEQLHAKLKLAEETLPRLQGSLDDAVARRDRLQDTRAEVEAEIQQLDAQIIELRESAKAFEARKTEVSTQRTLELNAHERLISARQALDALEAQAAHKQELEARRETAREEQALYSELRQAFGKNGVPAMIIETAIPELETTANDLLARMTDGRMHLRMTTQREKVTGGMAETLDIEIADELGTRSYETYSGGESFRINFAIRIALSKMLARRAGAHLRTLFIDEGFGTQDDQGRGKLVEAINAIQDDFDLILVITHIDELRDSFPVHLVIEKTRDGSTVAIR